MTLLQIFVLAVIQGLAELLPVSSSAHVIVAQKLMGLDPAAPQMTFLLVMLHTGTMGAVLVYFWPRWRDWLKPSSLKQTATLVVIATACTGILGGALKLFLEHVVLASETGEAGQFRDLFRSLPAISLALGCAAVLIIASGLYSAAKSKTPGFEHSEVTRGDAFWMGLVQGLCLPFRGFSRSGATISTGLFRGMNRAKAEDFSFLLVLVLTPPVILNEFKHLMDSAKEATAHGAPLDWAALLGPGVLGMFFSFAAGVAALKWLSSMLEHGRWHFFGFYALGASGFIFWLSQNGY